MQQPGDEGPRLQMWLGSIRQDQELSSGGLCVWERVLGVGRERRQKEMGWGVENGSITYTGIGKQTGRHEKLQL